MTASETTSPAPASGRVRLSQPWKLSAILGGATLILFWISLSVGPATIPMLEAIQGAFAVEPPVISTILVELRLPRSILAILVGATLGLSGAALQGLLRNPLAEPGIIGVSASAALGAVIVFYFGIGTGFAANLETIDVGATTVWITALAFSGGVALLYALAALDVGWVIVVVAVIAITGLAETAVIYFGLAAPNGLWVSIAGMAGALASVVILYGLAGRNAGVLTLILAGVAISSLAGALTSLALNLAPSPYAQSEIITWLLGSLADRSLEHVWLAAPFILAGWALLIASGRALDALSLGEDTAQTLGFTMNRVRLQVILGTALAVGAAVSVTGGIAFVGLVVPHLLRPLVGHEPRRLLIASALGGAVLLLAADIAVRLISEQTELKLGVLTAMVGAPFFLLLIYRTREQTQ